MRGPESNPHPATNHHRLPNPLHPRKQAPSTDVPPTNPLCPSHLSAADPDKVAAAQDVLDRVAAASPAARTVVQEMGELIDGYIELVSLWAGLGALYFRLFSACWEWWEVVLVGQGCMGKRIHRAAVSLHALTILPNRRQPCTAATHPLPRPRPRCHRPPRMLRRWRSRGACAARASEAGWRRGWAGPGHGSQSPPHTVAPLVPPLLHPLVPLTPRLYLRLTMQQCRNYTHLPVTSVTLPVDPSGRYEGFPHFVSFAERIK